MDTAEPQRFEIGAVSIDVRDRLRRLAGWTLLGSLLAVWPLAIFLSSVMGFLPLGALAVWIVTLALPRLRSVGPAPGTVTVEGSALTITVPVPGRAPIQRRLTTTQLTRGFRTDTEVRVELRKGETLVLGIHGSEEGEALLRAFGLDARRRVLEVPIASIASRVPGGVVFAWIMIVLQSPAVLSFPFLLLMILTRWQDWTAVGSVFWFLLVEVILLTAAICAVRPRSVAIGMDGIVYRRFLRKRFYPYGSIADVSYSPRGVTVARRSGERVILRTRGVWSRSGIDDAALALVERIETARAAASGHDVRAKLPLLERRSRTAAEWRAHLASLVGQAGYRTGAVTARDLAAVIDDASLSAEHRVAATLALAAAEPAEARTRARIAAAACADKGLRVALDHAAEGEIDEEQLARLAEGRGQAGA